MVRTDGCPKHGMRKLTGIRQGDMIPTRIVGRDPGPRGRVSGCADGFHAFLPFGRQPARGGEHFQLHPSVPGISGTSFQPHHGNLQTPAPQSIGVDEGVIFLTARVQISIFPRLAEARPLTSVHVGLSAGDGKRFRVLPALVIADGVRGGGNGGGAADAVAVHPIAGDFVLLDSVATRGRRAFGALPQVDAA